MSTSHACLSPAAAYTARRVPTKTGAKRGASSPAASRHATTSIRAQMGHGHGESAAGGGGAATAHGHGHGAAMGDRRPGEKKGFVEEMRFVAMKLHTREQAPKEGERKPEPESRPMAQWAPTKEGYLKYLVESRAVYEAMEAIVASGASPIYAAFVDTGLERTEALSADIAWFERAHGMPAPPADGPGAELSLIHI